MSFKFCPFVFNSLRSVLLRSVALASLILSFVLPVAYAHASDYYDQFVSRSYGGYPSCSRSKLAKDVLPADSPRRAFDGNLSQFHAYLSCVWWSGGPDAPSDDDYDGYSFYNSQCSYVYGCVPWHLEKDDDDVLKADRGDRSCGLNVMDLIITRRNHVGNNGQSAPLADICQAKIKNPIEIVCPGAIDDEREWEEKRGRSYQQPPNPCAPGSENFYMPYLIKAKAGMR